MEIPAIQQLQNICSNWQLYNNSSWG